MYLSLDTKANSYSYLGMSEGDTHEEKMYYLFFFLSYSSNKIFIPTLLYFPLNVNENINMNIQTGKLDYGKVRWQKSHNI